MVKRLTIDQHILLLTLGASLPGGVVALALLWTGDYTPKVQWTLTLFVVALLVGFAASVRARVVVPLQTLANLLAALREDDFSIRGRTANPDDPLGAALIEVNALAETLHEQRLGAVEATALLRTVMEQIDVAVFAFDPEHRLRIVNRTGERLMGRSTEQMLGRTAGELGVTDWFGDAPRVVDLTPPGGGAGRWDVRRTTFRLGGFPHDLLVLSDVSRPLREQERQAWQRLIRVIGHELGNSLGPIKSIAGSIETLLQRDPLPPDWREDMQRGLQVIAARAESLSRFTGAYARLARLPAPKPAAIVLKPFVQRLAGLETRVPVRVRPGPDLTVNGDPDQLEQLFINLLRNAADATLEVGGGALTLGWRRSRDSVDLWVDDEGPGLSNTANLFVPFFTTKAGGSGIGLVLCRQIAEAHEGSLRLENRTGTRGCRATLTLPA
ncbi:MAG: PAS domain-containing sensor histidine kinase [Acidobacteria bacterium]|nr:PAS domain-containing sensor histidine kinase [Acidobacteriota bacterium]